MSTPLVIYGSNQCENPIYIKDLRMHVNCGKCEYCRKLWINDWSTRLCMQKEMSKLTICMTLTYNNENLPKINGVPSLSKDDIQKFFKRVRKKLSKDYKDVSIQYFISGEYGSSFLRPHYHLILFINTENNTYSKYDFQSICLEKWQKGYIQFMPQNHLSISYLAKYIGKTTGISEYAELNNLPLPFVLMSRNPAIGAKYLEINENFEKHFKCLDDCHVHLPGLGNKLIPRYVRKKVTQHLPKPYKEKYYQQLQDKKLLDYEQRLENRSNRCRINRDNIQYCIGSVSEKEYERRQRTKQNFIKAKQIEDLNYIKQKNEYIFSNSNSKTR